MLDLRMRLIIILFRYFVQPKPVSTYELTCNNIIAETTKVEITLGDVLSGVLTSNLLFTSVLYVCNLLEERRQFVLKCQFNTCYLLTV